VAAGVDVAVVAVVPVVVAAAVVVMEVHRF
jgi:hypothetical protein